MEALTRRQRQIATLIVRGLTNAEIGAELGLSRGTIANHIRHIMKRLGVGSRVEVAVWTVRMSADPAQIQVGESGASFGGPATIQTISRAQGRS